MKNSNSNNCTPQENFQVMIQVIWIVISFVMRQWCFPHIGFTFSFLHRECVNLHEGRLRNKMHLHSTLKGWFFVLNYFDQSQELKTIAKKSLQFNNNHVPCTHIGFLCYSN